MKFKGEIEITPKEIADIVRELGQADTGVESRFVTFDDLAEIFNFKEKDALHEDNEERADS